MHDKEVYGVIFIELKREISHQYGVVEKYACRHKDYYTQFKLIEEAFNYTSAQRLATFFILMKREQVPYFRAFNYEIVNMDVVSSLPDMSNGKTV